MVFGGEPEGHNRRPPQQKAPQQKAITEGHHTRRPPEVPGGDPPQPPDSYCCGQYTSYWNVFLFIMCRLKLMKRSLPLQRKKKKKAKRQTKKTRNMYKTGENILCIFWGFIKEPLPRGHRRLSETKTSN